ncbi:MAG: archease [Longimicrobiales bacterium]|nr:archease [Longimicrobiales bacterium]
MDHTAETTLRLRAPTFAGLVREATRGFLSLVPDASRGALLPGERTFEIDAGDRTAALVEWINEMVFRSEAEGWLPVEVSVQEHEGGHVEVRYRAQRLLEPFVLVKAATFHGADIRETADGLVVDLTLDI